MCGQSDLPARLMSRHMRRKPITGRHANDMLITVTVNSCRSRLADFMLFGRHFGWAIQKSMMPVWHFQFVYFLSVTCHCSCYHTAAMTDVFFKNHRCCRWYLSITDVADDNIYRWGWTFQIAWRKQIWRRVCSGWGWEYLLRWFTHTPWPMESGKSTLLEALSTTHWSGNYSPWNYREESVSNRR